MHNQPQVIDEIMFKRCSPMHIDGAIVNRNRIWENIDELHIPASNIRKQPFHRFHRFGIKMALAWKEFRDKREIGG